MNMPNKVSKALANKEESRRKEIKEKQEERERERKQEQKLVGKEKNLFPQKVELCKKILSWADEFRQTKEGQKLIKKRDVYGRYVKAVTIGGWNCDPRTGQKANKPFLSFDVTSNGVAHEERWCWLGYTYTEFTEPEKMAHKLYHAYLQLVWKHLESGKVFDYLVRGVKDDDWDDD